MARAGQQTAVGSSAGGSRQKGAIPTGWAAAAEFVVCAPPSPTPAFSCFRAGTCQRGAVLSMPRLGMHDLTLPLIYVPCIPRHRRLGTDTVQIGVCWRRPRSARCSFLGQAHVKQMRGSWHSSVFHASFPTMCRHATGE